MIYLELINEEKIKYIEVLNVSGTGIMGEKYISQTTNGTWTGSANYNEFYWNQSNGYKIKFKEVPKWIIINKKTYRVNNWGYGDCENEKQGTVVVGHDEMIQIFNDLYGVENVKN